jgi:hypothetical protein
MLVLYLQPIDWDELRGKKVSPPFLPHLDIISADDVDENQFGVASDPRSAGTWRPRSDDPFKVRTCNFPTFIACRIRTRLISGPFRTRVGSRGSRSLRGVTVRKNSDVIIRPWPILCTVTLVWQTDFLFSWAYSLFYSEDTILSTCFQIRTFLILQTSQ